MKKLMILGVLWFGGVLVAEGAGRAPVWGFLRTSLGVAVPQESGYSTAFTVGLEGGVLLGARQEHEFGIGFSGMSWTREYRAGPDPYDPYRRSMDYVQSYMPLTLEYSYHLNLDRSGRVQVYAGPLVGVTLVSAEERGRSGGGWWYYGDDVWSSDSREAFTWGGNLGVRWMVRGALEVTVGYRYMVVNGGSVETYDVGRVEQPKMHLHTILVMVGARW